MVRSGPVASLALQSLRTEGRLGIGAVTVLALKHGLEGKAWSTAVLIVTGQTGVSPFFGVLGPLRAWRDTLCPHLRSPTSPCKDQADGSYRIAPVL